MTSNALRTELANVARTLGRDELRVLIEIARRLGIGARAYGVLDIEGDARDWKREATEELLDGCVYLACESLRTGPSSKDIARTLAETEALIEATRRKVGP